MAVCKECREDYNRTTVRRSHGEFSPVYNGGYCSAKCYTKAVLEKPKYVDITLFAYVSTMSSNGIKICLRDISDGSLFEEYQFEVPDEKAVLHQLNNIDNVDTVSVVKVNQFLGENVRYVVTVKQ